MGRVLFGMVDNRVRPIGGVKVIYQAVGGLRRRGFDAYVASAVPVPDWLAGSRALEDVEILDMSRPQTIGTHDLYVATDAIGPHRIPMLLGRPERRVIFVQNHNALSASSGVDWTRLVHIRCLTVSEYSRRHLLETWKFRDVRVVAPGVDRAVFRPGSERKHRIAYMPRKWPELASLIRERTSGAIEWCPIDRASESETAVILGSSTIFLNLGRNEGFGLPALEAMAAGCVVCGFAGQGTTDFATPENGFWASEGDIDGCVRAVDAAVAAVVDADHMGRMITAGLATAERYSLAAFENAMAAYIGTLV